MCVAKTASGIDSSDVLNFGHEKPVTQKTRTNEIQLAFVLRFKIK